MLRITRTSPLTGIERTLELDITEEQLAKWENGALIQTVMPKLSEDEREFLMTGIYGEEWDTFFQDS